MDRVKKLSDITGDRAFAAFADLIPAIMEMAADEQATKFFSGNLSKSRLENAAALMQITAQNKQAFLQIEAVKRGCDVSELSNLSMDDILMGGIDLMNDSLFKTFFALAHRDMVAKSSISAPDPTEAPAD